jgi:tyrosyl-tRNA synthetase
LANEVTKLIHGEQALVQAQVSSDVLFGGSVESITENDFADIIGEIPTQELELAKLAAPGTSLIELLVHAGLCPSKGQARKDVEGGGVYLNNVRMADPARAVTTADLLFGKHLLLRKGKKNYVVLTVR